MEKLTNVSSSSSAYDEPFVFSTRTLSNLAVLLNNCANMTPSTSWDPKTWREDETEPGSRGLRVCAEEVKEGAQKQAKA